MEPRRVRPLGTEELAGLTTERLLAYRARLLGLEESASLSDYDANELAHLAPGFIYFKDDPRWRPLYALVTSLLDTREHVERPGRVARRTAARRSR